ncbi:hypothetical protein OUZ56_011264 [Daphnia magna]|uniref:Uncharacterized protein n=1 Tax=Daphnia magna TaxID=35525 RepID=A0ABQ9YZM7_9CRUS|nr:hypothetical protein OUZ56_011264 [Daphnia magna]
MPPPRHVRINGYEQSADTSPQFILPRPHFQTVHIRNGSHFILKSTKSLSKILSQSAGESPQFLQSTVHGPRPHFILAQIGARIIQGLLGLLQVFFQQNTC